LGQLFLYIGGGFLVGFIAAWIIRTLAIAGVKKSLKSTGGFLESEKLMKERLQKENTRLLELKESSRLEYELKIQELDSMNKKLDEDILLLQRSNEETEALLQAGEPVIHSLKLKLIEAQNAIARYKAQIGIKT
jgi:hypothetical protein